MYGLGCSSFRSLAVFLIFIPAALGQNGTVSPSSNATVSSNATANCQCGFLDPATGSVWTDSAIVYFNETDSIPTDIFSVDTFRQRYAKGWSIYYLEGAIAENVYFEKGSTWNLSPGWLNMNVSAYTPQHLVNGAQLQSVRQDIQYGTFRVFMRSPAPYAGGSAMTMRLQYNGTSSAELDLLNMDDSANNACMQTSVSNQDPLTNWGVNYTVMEEPQHNVGPWDFWEWRMDWTADEIDWYIGTWKTRSVPATNASLVDVPTAFYLKAWSNGDANFMQGPPTNNSAASVGYVRLFFNVSGDSTSHISGHDCDASQMCSTEDWTLRVTTPYTETSTIRWRPEMAHESRKATIAGIALCAASLVVGVAVVLQGLLRQRGDKSHAKHLAAGPRRPKMATSPWPSTDALSRTSKAWTTQTDLELYDLKPTTAGASSTTLLNDVKFPHPALLGTRERTMSEQPLLTRGQMTPGTVTPGTMTPGPMTSSTMPLEAARFSQYFANATAIDAIDQQRQRESDVHVDPQQRRVSTIPLTQGNPAEASTADLLTGRYLPQVPEGSSAVANPGAKPVPIAKALPQARTRVDYLAGLVAVCSLLVSCTHFILTYVPSVIMNYLPNHYESEGWARKTIEPFFFNEVWVGLFFTTSTRFLTSGYLRTGNLKTIAEKIVCRCPRLMIPITAVIIFEYFLMDLGATKYLEYIPSITWSTWPSTSVYPNFGWFIDETLQLFYLIPNAAPQLTWNYCTGVLWTIPVQLQFSWVVLLGVVVIREIKTPWKRMCYYAFCLVTNWYALSWGSYFYAGLLLADLDITYKYRKWVQARWWVHYPLLTIASIAVFLSLANDLFPIYSPTDYTFSTAERGIHPEVQSALPLKYTSEAGYPPYTEPKLNGLVFAVGSQYIVELSTWTQWVLSRKAFLWLFPHVFTIYLIHGLVFWSIGSLVCVYFAGQGLSFWLNILLTAIICYATLFACLPIVTPVMEMLGKEITKGIWVSASEEPAPWRPSSYPFSVEEIRTMVYRVDDDDRSDGSSGRIKGKRKLDEG